MATKAEVLQTINSFIIANANNEITADVLRPILESMVNQINDLTGETLNLNTTDKTNLVNALNEIIQESGTGVTVHTGTGDPNVNPPASYVITDYYKRVVNGTLAGLYIFNGSKWILIQDVGQAVQQTAKIIIQDYTVQITDSIIIAVSGTQTVMAFLPQANQMPGRVLTLSNHSDSKNFLLSRPYVERLTGTTPTNKSTISPLSSVQIVSIGNNWYKVL